MKQLIDIIKDEFSLLKQQYLMIQRQNFQKTFEIRLKKIKNGKIKLQKYCLLRMSTLRQLDNLYVSKKINPSKKERIYQHSSKEHLKFSKTAKFGCEIL